MWNIVQTKNRMEHYEIISFRLLSHWFFGSQEVLVCAAVQTLKDGPNPKANKMPKWIINEYISVTQLNHDSWFIVENVKTNTGRLSFGCTMMSLAVQEEPPPFRHHISHSLLELPQNTCVMPFTQLPPQRVSQMMYSCVIRGKEQSYWEGEMLSVGNRSLITDHCH